MSDESDKLVTFSNYSLEPGEVFASRYELCSLLGSGGMGQVCLVKDRQLNGELLALKLLHPQYARDEQVYKRFQNEVVVARALFHPNIVRIFDFGREEPEICYISMEHVCGGSLKDKIKEAASQAEKGEGENCGLPFDESVRYLYQILSAVAYAHRQGVVHRDIKPANVLLGEDGQAKLGDFGTARSLESSAQLTRTGQMIGTLGYMSPEQVQGERGDVTSDVYSLGILAYELVVGKLPFQGENFYEIAVKQIQDIILPFSGGKTGVPRWYEEMVRKATSVNPKDRFPSGKEFFDYFLSHLPAAKLRELEEGGEGRKKSVAPKTVWSVALFLILLLGLLVVFVSSREESAKDNVDKFQLAKKVLSKETQIVDLLPQATLPSREELERDLLAGLRDFSAEPKEAKSALPLETASLEEGDAKDKLGKEESLFSEDKLSAARPVASPDDLAARVSADAPKEESPPLSFSPIPSAQQSALAALSALELADDSRKEAAKRENRRDEFEVTFNPASYKKVESFSGTIFLSFIQDKDAEEQAFTLDIGLNDNEIAGRARIVGIGDFAVKGKLIPGKIEQLELHLERPDGGLELFGERKELGPNRDPALAGKFSSETYSESGWWRVEWVRRNIASSKRLRELLEPESSPGSPEN